MTGIRVIAHRGASRDCPENTYAAFDEALRQGADGIELDLQLSRDGIPVAYHDRTLARAGGGRKRVAGLDLAELERLAPGFPTLEQIMKRYGRRTRLFIEIKTREGSSGQERHRELARAAALLVARSKTRDKHQLLSFDVDVLRAAADAAPEVRRALNLKPPRRLGPKLRAVLPLVSTVCADIRSLTPEFARALSVAGRPLYAWTCNTPHSVTRAVAAGVEGVMSDRPAWLAERLKEHRG